MTLRTRILLGSILLVLLPLTVLGQLVRRSMDTHFTSQYRMRVDSILQVVSDVLDAQREAVHGRLRAFGSGLSEDNHLRLYLQNRNPEAEEDVRSLAERAMPLLGLDMLQIQDETGEILSCGHFWSMFGSRQPGLPPVMAAANGAWVLLEVPRQEGSFLAMAGLDSIRVGSHRLYLIGGLRLTEETLHRLARDPGMRIVLHLPEGNGTEPGISTEGSAVSTSVAPDSAASTPTDAETAGMPRYLTRSISLPFVSSRGGVNTTREASIEIGYPLTALDEFLRRFQSWLLATVGVLAAGSVLLAFWLSHRLTRSIVDLAHRAEKIDLERLDATFPTGRRDEVGVLARCLETMMAGLRAGASRLREAEKRATLGDVARQVNHDLKNGLIPIRNVFRHLSELLERDPEAVPRVLAERRSVVDSSLLYLEELAANYARIARRPTRQGCRMNEIVRQVGVSVDQGRSPHVRLELDPTIGEISIDPVSLRRIVENLVGNAAESLGRSEGTITISTGRRANEAGESGIEFSVLDTGPGIPEEIRERIFEDFFTTREKGSGLGLSIVRRLVSDYGGTIAAENVAPRGARFAAWFPAREIATTRAAEGDKS